MSLPGRPEDEARNALLEGGPPSASTPTAPPACVSAAAPTLRKRMTTLLGAAPDEREHAGFRSFELEAGDVMSRRRTQRAQKIVRAAIVVVLLLLVWAALARVDEITKGDARVISSRQLQLVQSLDGGVVSEILVKEGQVVVNASERDARAQKLAETTPALPLRPAAAASASVTGPTPALVPSTRKP